MGLSHTVSGDIASFRTPSRVPIESLKIHFLPKQEGSGDPSPVNIRPISGWTESDFDQHGINLWDEDWEIGRININTGKNDNNVTSTIRSKNYIPCRPGTKYFIKHSMRTNNLCLFFYDKHKNFISYGWKYSVEVTVPDNCYYLRFYLHSTYGTEYYNDVGINYPSSKTSYVPYSGNARISITFPASGKNQFNPNAEWIIGSPYRYIPFYFGENDYYMSFTVKDPNVDTSDLYIGFSYFEPISSADATIGYNWCIEKGVIKQNHTNRISQGATSDYYGMVGRYLFVYPNTADAYSRLVSAYDIQIEKGTSPTAYEPYASDNIVYGGYVDPVAGEIVAEYAKKVFNGSESGWGAIGDDWNTDNTGFCIRVPELTHIIDSNNIIKANLLRRSLYYNISYGQFYVAKDSWANLRLRMTESMTLQEFKTFLSQNNLEIVYPIATPIHIPIPTEDIKAFLDHNNFWSDANDITEVTYNVCNSNMILQTKKNIIAENSKHYRKVLWNQWLPPLDENGWKPYTTSYTTATFSDGIATNTWLTDNVGYSASIRDKSGTVQHAGEIWYASYMVKTSTSNLQWGIEMCGGNQLRYITSTQPDIWKQCSAVSAYNRGTTNYTYICNLSTADGDQTGTVAQVASPILVNLTAMFGPGNEPTKKEFEALCEINHVDLTQYHPQTSGVEQIWCIPSINLDDYITVEWNQWARPVTSDYYKPYNNNNISVTVENGIITQTWLTKAVDYNAAVCSPVTKTHQANRYYYLSYEYCADFAGYIGGTVGGQSAYNYDSKTIPNQWDRFRCLVKRTEGGTYQNYVVYLGRFTSGSEIEIGNTCLLKNPIAIDITQMFGAGNEPKSAAEFEYLCTINNINLTEYHAYNSGTKIIWKI